MRDGPNLLKYELLVLDAGCEPFERLPPWIGAGGLSAVTGCIVQVLSAVDAKSFAVLLAQRPSGQGEQHLLAHHVLKQQTVGSIIPYLGLIFGDGAFAGVGVGFLGAEEQVEVARERHGDGIDAASAEDFERTFVGGANADVFDEILGAAVFEDEVGFAFDGQRPHLEGVYGVVDGSGRDLFMEEERFILQVDRVNEHRLSVGLAGLEVKWCGMVTEAKGWRVPADERGASVMRAGTRFVGFVPKTRLL